MTFASTMAMAYVFIALWIFVVGVVHVSRHDGNPDRTRGYILVFFMAALWPLTLLILGLP
jgi:hypothetical protein